MAGWVEEGGEGQKEKQRGTDPSISSRPKHLQPRQHRLGGGMLGAEPLLLRCHCHVPYLSTLPLGCSVFWAFSAGGQRFLLAWKGLDGAVERDYSCCGAEQHGLPSRDAPSPAKEGRWLRSWSGPRVSGAWLPRALHRKLELSSVA